MRKRMLLAGMTALFMVPSAVTVPSEDNDSDAADDPFDKAWMAGPGRNKDTRRNGSGH